MSLCWCSLGLCGVSGGVGTSLLGVGGCGSRSGRSRGRSARLEVSSIVVIHELGRTDRGIVIDLVWGKRCKCKK